MSIRLRLALWCGALFCVLLTVIGVAVYQVHARAHYDDIDQTLTAMTDHFRIELERELAEGTPLDRTLLASLDDIGSQLAGAELTVYDASGSVIFGPVWTDGTLPTEIPRDVGHAPETFTTVDTEAGRVRVHTMALGRTSEPAGYVQTSVSLATVDRSIARFRLLLTVAMLGGVLMAAVGSLTLASRALRPIAEVTETARAIALSRGFGRRLESTAQRDELGELARTFNEMLASLEVAHQSQRRFIDDAAHELRAPVTSLIGNIEFLDRAGELPAEEHHVVLEDLRAEAERLGRLVHELLALARADAGQQLGRVLLDLDRLVVEEVRRIEPRAEYVDLSIAALEPVQVQGDPDRLRQLLVILLDNALQYTPAGGSIRVSLRRDGDEAVLAVADTGMGIAAEDVPRIFDRFYRTDPARSRVAGGSGLGLAIAKWIAEAHDGRIEVVSQVGSGTTFTLVLPVAPEARDWAEGHGHDHAATPRQARLHHRGAGEAAAQR